MYINVEADPQKPPKWQSKRGTSALEGFHRHWHELLPSFNTSPELASALMSLFLGRWNRKKSFKHGDIFYGTHNYQLLNSVNRIYEDLGAPHPYPDAQVPKPVMEEGMLDGWSSLAPLPGGASIMSTVRKRLRWGKHACSFSTPFTSRTDRPNRREHGWCECGHLSAWTRVPAAASRRLGCGC